jgi:hypothetical protein
VKDYPNELDVPQLIKIFTRGYTLSTLFPNSLTDSRDVRSNGMISVEPVETPFLRIRSMAFWPDASFLHPTQKSTHFLRIPRSTLFHCIMRRGIIKLPITTCMCNCSNFLTTSRPMPLVPPVITAISSGLRGTSNSKNTNRTNEISQAV